MVSGKAKYITYILQTDKNTLYTGYTSDLEKRLLQHMGKIKGGAKYMRAFEVFTVVYTKTFETKSEAMKWEAQIKKLTRKEKQELIFDASY